MKASIILYDNYAAVLFFGFNIGPQKNIYRVPTTPQIFIRVSNWELQRVNRNNGYFIEILAIALKPYLLLITISFKFYIWGKLMAH